MGNKLKYATRSKKRSYKSNAEHMNDIKRLVTVLPQRNHDCEVFDKSPHSSLHVLKESFSTQALQSFKKLHRTRLKVFAGDEKALNAARIKINEEFNKNKHVTDENSIKAMIKFSEDVERELRTQVIQAKEVKPGVFEAKLTEDTVKFENIPYDDTAVPDEGIKGGGRRKCCQEDVQKN